MNWNAHRTRVIIWPVEKNRQHLQKKDHEMNKKTNALNHFCTLKLKGGNKEKSSLTKQSILHKKYCRMLKPQTSDLKTWAFLFFYSSFVRTVVHPLSSSEKSSLHLGLPDFVRTCNVKRRLDERGGLTLSERKSTEAIVQFIQSSFVSLLLTIIGAD